MEYIFMPMTTMFLANNELTDKIQNVINDSTELKIAVPFWSQRLVPSINNRIKVPKASIICNLKLGCTDPKAIIELQKKNSIMQNDHLHAKIYLDNPKRLVLASVNASINGFGHKEGEIANLLETGIYTEDPELISAANKWFDDLLKDEETHHIKKIDLDEAQKRYDRARIRILKERRSVLEVNEEDMKNSGLFFVCFYEDSHLDENDYNRNVNEEIQRKNDIVLYNDENISYCEEWGNWDDLKPGKYHISVHLKTYKDLQTVKKPDIEGFYLIPEGSVPVLIMAEDSINKNEVMFCYKYNEIKINNKFYVHLLNKDIKLLKYIWLTIQSHNLFKEVIGQNQEELREGFTIGLYDFFNNRTVKKIIEKYNKNLKI
jgi:hypothetical protein